MLIPKFTTWSSPRYQKNTKHPPRNWTQVTYPLPKRLVPLTSCPHIHRHMSPPPWKKKTWKGGSMVLNLCGNTVGPWNLNDIPTYLYLLHQINWIGVMDVIIWINQHLRFLLSLQLPFEKLKMAKKNTFNKNNIFRMAVLSIATSMFRFISYWVRLISVARFIYRRFIIVDLPDQINAPFMASSFASPVVVHAVDGGVCTQQPHPPNHGVNLNKTMTSWWFQPLRKILVKLGTFPK